MLFYAVITVLSRAEQLAKAGNRTAMVECFRELSLDEFGEVLRHDSSKARPQPPGAMEWREGERVLTWACHRLGCTDAERDQVLLAFLRQCWRWLNRDLERRPRPPALTAHPS